MSLSRRRTASEEITTSNGYGLPALHYIDTNTTNALSRLATTTHYVTLAQRTSLLLLRRALSNIEGDLSYYVLRCNIPILHISNIEEHTTDSMEG